MRMDSSEIDQLLMKAANGERAAKDRLLSVYRERLRRMIAVRMDQRLRNRVDASDIVQETMVMADRRFDEYLRDPPIPFYPWLRQLAWDQLVAMHRKHLFAGRRSRRREEDAAAALRDESMAQLASCLLDDSMDPLTRLLRAELRNRVREAIDQLQEMDREILVLRHLEHVSMAEAAEILAISASAAKMRHLRAIERLKPLLGNPLGESSD
jgi:RNA polymerase sigma-70 factor (ECF subfamily)